MCLAGHPAALRAPPAALDTARYERFAAFLEDQGLIKSPPPVADYAVELRR